ncbi:MAG: hypothetical protein ACI4BD_03285 [Paludibacteraceae bacterium]
MKKLCLVAATLVAMVLGMTGCGTTEVSDVTIYCRVSYSASGNSLNPVTPGIDDSELKDIFKSHMLTLGAPFGDDAIIIRSQSNEKNVKQAILQAAQEADEEVKAKYGDPVAVQSNFKKLKMSVYYDFGGNPEVEVVTYTYKEE